MRLNFTGNIRRLRLRLGDIVCVESEIRLSPDEADALHDQFVEAFPRNSVLLLSKGFTHPGAAPGHNL